MANGSEGSASPTATRQSIVVVRDRTSDAAPATAKRKADAGVGRAGAAACGGGSSGGASPSDRSARPRSAAVREMAVALLARAENRASFTVLSAAVQVL